MKLTAILLIGFLIQANARSYAQKLTFSGKNINLEKVFNVIEEQTGYVVFYNYKVIQNASPVTLNAKDEPLEEFLKDCFINQELKYVIEGKTILVTKKDSIYNLSRADFLSNFHPPITIHGKVLDSLGNPIVGATISIKGTKLSTGTNADGEFVINGIADNATIVVSSVGYETVQAEVGGKTAFFFQLKQKTTDLKNVDVTYSTGYQYVPKDRATGSFAQPNKLMYDNRVSTDVLSKLGGITSGLVFNTTANGNQVINIRGSSTIFANSQPLIVVDNFPYEGDINNINPNDVESVTILKDAAAASIWGVRAGNGVIVITTKTGKMNQPVRVDFNANVTVSAKPNLNYDPNFLNSADFIGVEKTLFNSGFYDGDITNTSFPPLSPVVGILNDERNGNITADQANAMISSFSNNDVRNSLSKYFYQHAVNQQYAISLSGGNEKASYLFSAGYDNNTGSQVGSKNNRLTLNSLATFLPMKNLTVTAGIYYSQIKSETDNTLSQINTGGPGGKVIYPYASFANVQGNPLPIVKDYRQGFSDSAEINGFQNWQFYPLKEKGLNTTTINNYETRLRADIGYRIIKGLNAVVKYQYERSLTDNNTLAQQSSYFARNSENQYSTVDNGQFVSFNMPLGGIYSINNANLESQNLRGELNYANTWNKNSLTAIGGVEAREVKVQGYGNMLYGYSNDNGTSQPVDPLTYYPQYPSGNYGPISQSTGIASTLNRFRSYFVNGAYTYDSRYTVSMSGRIDQSNFFGVNANQRSVPLWSAGFLWNASNESFYHLSWLPILHVRATYGFNGNLDKTVTAYTTAEYLSYSLYTGAPYVQIDNPPNPNLQWEKTRMIDLGIDFAIKNRIISGSFDYYNRLGSDLMGDQILPPSSGFVNPTTFTNSIRGNFAAMKGYGVDLQLNSKNLDGEFKWTTSFLFSYTTDKVTQFDIENPPATLVNYGNGYNNIITPLVGKPVYGIYSYKWAGLNATTGDPQGYVDKQVSSDYGTLLNPTSVDDIIYNGPARPTFFGGLGNNFTWKHFTLFANISYKMGYYFRRSSINYYTLYNAWQGNIDFASRWQNPGDESKTNVPSMPAFADPSRDQFYGNSQVLVDKGDHIRLQDISLSYRFEKSQYSQLPFQYIQIYGYANNVGIIWRANKQGLDPDVVAGYPTPKSFSIGIKAGF